MKLSDAPSTMRAGYDVVVVGSGYGASVTAARLAAAGAKVCVLERGKEFAVGEFPSTEASVRKDFQLDANDLHLGNRLALYDLRFNKDMSVLVGCGLGGTSLINANVSIEPDPRVFNEPQWPAQFRDAETGLLAPYFARARSVLKPTPYPAHWPTPAKLAALQAAAEKSGRRFHRAELNIHFDGDDPEMKPCRSCGNCVTGCNFGAKRTTAMSYLPMAKRAGAHIFTQHEVVGLKPRDGGGWTVAFQRLVTGNEKEDAPRGSVEARAVILGGGVLGSTGILLRAARDGLSLSPRLGTRFGGNGDELAAGFDFDRRIDSVGWRGKGEPGNPPTGALITGIVDARDPDKPLHAGMILEEGGFPGPVSPLSRVLLDLLALVEGQDTTRPTFKLFMRRIWRVIVGLFAPWRLDSALNHSQLYLIMGHDDSGGKIVLDDAGRPRIQWPSTPEEEALFAKENELAKELTAALQGISIPNPLSKSGLVESPITVHPLGGSPMGDDPDQGVVDHAGRVFRGGGGIWEGLYVADGAIVPRSLGVNPLLTITALAERVADHAARDLGFPPPS